MAREYYEFARAAILNDNFEVDEFPEDIWITIICSAVDVYLTRSM